MQSDSIKVYRDHRQSIAVLQLPDALLRRATVVQVTGMSSSTIDRAVRAGRFPAPLKHGLRCTRWRSADVSEWVRSFGSAEPTAGGSP